MSCLYFVALQNETWEHSRTFILGSTELKRIKLQAEIPHDDDDDDDKFWFCMTTLVEHKIMCFVCFIFRKDIFKRKKAELEEQKGQKRGKITEVKQLGKDKI